MAHVFTLQEKVWVEEWLRWDEEETVIFFFLRPQETVELQAKPSWEMF